LLLLNKELQRQCRQQTKLALLILLLLQMLAMQQHQSLAPLPLLLLQQECQLLLSLQLLSSSNCMGRLQRSSSSSQLVKACRRHSRLSSSICSSPQQPQYCQR
jgi:hypothetical protein